jgi:hypothetical protein
MYAFFLAAKAVPIKMQAVERTITSITGKRVKTRKPRWSLSTPLIKMLNPP